MIPSIPPASLSFAPILPTAEETAAVYPAVTLAPGDPARLKTAESEKARKASAESQWAQGRAVRRVQFSAAVAALRAVGASVDLRPVPDSAPLPTTGDATKALARMRRTVRVIAPNALRDRSGYTTAAWYVVPFGRGYALTAGSVAAEEAVYRQTERPHWVHASAVSTKHRDARAVMLSVLYVMIAEASQ